MADNPVSKVELDRDFVASAKRLEELKNNRDLQDIPITDEYWKALKKHRVAHNN